MRFSGQLKSGKKTNKCRKQIDFLNAQKQSLTNSPNRRPSYRRCTGRCALCSLSPSKKSKGKIKGARKYQMTSQLYIQEYLDYQND